MSMSSVAKPDLVANGGIYSLSWPDQGILIRVDRIAEHKNEVTGEITVRTTLPGLAPHLHQARLNLTSTTARKTLARALTERISLPWDDILEQACVLTLQAQRAGELISEVGNQPREVTPPWLLHPLLRRGQPSLLYGPGKTGKSYIAALCGLIVQTGQPHTGLTPYPTHDANVLYLDYEASSEELNIRVSALASGMDLPPGTRLLYRRSYQPLATEIAEIRREVIERNVVLLIVDSLGLACGGDPEAANSILPYFSALRSLAVTSLTVHHIPKDAARGPYGSVYVVNMARSAYEVKRAQETGGTDIQVGIYHRYANNGRLTPPLGLTFSFAGQDPDGDPESVTVARQRVIEVPELAQGLSLRERMKASLRDGKKLVKALAEELGAPETVVRATLNRYKGTTFVALPGPTQGDTLWGISAFDSETQGGETGS